MGAVFSISAAGYLLYGWTLIDAVYMVVITMFGVGFGEVHPVATVAGKVFTICVIVGGEQPSTEKNLRQLGADEVVLPASIGGTRIAHSIARPTTMKFLLVRIPYQGKDKSLLKDIDPLLVGSAKVVYESGEKASLRASEEVAA